VTISLGKAKHQVDVETRGIDQSLLTNSLPQGHNGIAKMLVDLIELVLCRNSLFGGDLLHLLIVIRCEQALKYVAPLLSVGTKESGELSLRQHNHLTKLFKA
jgi:hypothetical protein